jgi:hypothetical protein
MYTAINNRVICKVQNDTNLTKQVLAAKVIGTTKATEKLEGKTIFAERRHFTDLGDAGEESKTSTGIILGDKISFASVDVENIVAIKDEA